MLDSQEGYKKFLSVVDSIGGLAVSTLFPSEFEYYMIAFELCNGETGRTIDYFSFPILPSNLRSSEKMINSTKKTFGGVTNLSSSQFNPISISLQGDFGKAFKVLLKNNDVYNLLGLTSDYQSIDDGVLVRNYVTGDDRQLGKVTQNRIFNASLKTGYGCLKVLKAICNKSQGQSENGVPYRLYFYNMALGESFVVKINSIDVDMSTSKNAIWNYNIQMTAVLPLEYDLFKSKNSTESGSLRDSLATGVIQKGLTSFTNSVIDSFTKPQIFFQ